MKKPLSRLFTRSIEIFLSTESASGVLLAISALGAMLFANGPLSSIYFQILHASVFGLSIQHWINDGLMTIFFFVIGMEIKKELVVGELSSARKANLPIAAALGGMAIPALIYLFFNPTTPNSNGWGIPMATDIAFAIGILTLFGKRVPLSLKVFLLALAIVDDLGAVLVIAFFYTKQIHLLGLLIAAFALIPIYLGKKRGVSSYSFYTAMGILTWIGVLYSGVHATVAGVLIGLMTPYKFDYGVKLIKTYSPLEDLVHKLHPLVSFGIMPLFALANAGVPLAGIEFSQLIHNSIHQGIAIGLLAGKPIGIFLFSFVAVRMGVAALPTGLRWIHIIGTAFLGGIGFTMAIFISGLALPVEQEVYSKTGILLGSLVAAVFGSVILLFEFSKVRSDIVHHDRG